MEDSQPLATESFSYGWLTDKKTPSSHGLGSIFHENSSQIEHSFNFDIPFSNSSIALVHADEIFSDGHIMPVYDERPQLDALSTPSTSVPTSPIGSRNPFFDNLQSESRISSRESLKCSFFDKEAHISSRDSIDCSGTRFFDQKEFDSNAGYRSRNLSNNITELHLLGKWRKSSKRILEKCFGFVKPFCKTIGCSMKSSRVDDLERKVCEIQSWGNSLEASPRASSAYFVVERGDVKKIGTKFDLDLGIKKVKSWNSSPQGSPRVSSSRSSNSCYDVESSIHEAILYCKRSIEK